MKILTWNFSNLSYQDCRTKIYDFNLMHIQDKTAYLFFYKKEAFESKVVNLQHNNNFKYTFVICQKLQLLTVCKKINIFWASISKIVKLN